MIPGVPYDAEIEYLDVIAPAYIDTGVFVTTELDVIIDGAWLSSSKNLGTICGSGGDTYGLFRYRKTASPVHCDIMTVNGSGGTVWRNMSSTPLNRHTYQLGKNGLYTDGVKKYSESVFQSTTNYTIKLAGYNDGNTANQGTCRFWGVTILSYGVKVRDFIPVRVGQTGYMYDRVTRRLFGNKGTGSFNLGPDVAKPVMGLWGMRKFYNARDYIQDGLVAMWDGINNTGHGHDPEATVWKDLVGDRDFTLNGAVVGQDNISWNGNYRSTSSHQPPNFVQMEILFRTISNWNWKVWFGDYGHSVSSYFGAVLESKTARQDNSSYRFYTLAVSIPLVEPSEAGKRWATKIYEKGVLKNISNNFNYVGTDWAANTMQLGGSTGLSLRCIRLYSRYLSDAEIAHNYQIDKARFNLP